MSETIPTGFLLFSEAVALLAQGIWGGLTRPTPVLEVKQYEGQVSVTFGPWKEKAGQCLTLAAVREQIPVYVIGRSQAEAGRVGPELTRVPAPLGAPLPLLLQGANLFLVRGRRQTSGTRCREMGCACPTSPQCPGRGTARQRCTAEPGLHRRRACDDPGSAAHHFRAALRPRNAERFARAGEQSPPTGESCRRIKGIPLIPPRRNLP
jgi:hypothetical protein